MSRVVVVGAGISGLAFSYQLRWRQPELPSGLELTVLDAAPRVGGTLQSRPTPGGGVGEVSLDGFEGNAPWLLSIISRLGLSDDVIQAPDDARDLQVYYSGALGPRPTSPKAILSLPGLSGADRLRVLREPMAPEAPPGMDETLAAFLKRHLGPKAGGILSRIFAETLAGDPDALSLEAAFPQLKALVERHGSILKAGLIESSQRTKQGEGAAKGSRVVDQVVDQVVGLFAANVAEAGMRPPQGGSLLSGTSTFATLKGGLEQLPQTLAQSPGIDVQLGYKVTSIHGPGDGRLSGPYTLTVQGPEGEKTLECDGIFLALPASKSASLLNELDPGLSQNLRAIPQAHLTEVRLTFDPKATPGIMPALPGRGYLVPRGEGIRHRRAIWDHNAFPEKGRGGEIRVFFGGMGDEAAHDLTPEALIDLAKGELGTILGVDVAAAQAEVFPRAHRLPQYVPGHGDKVSAIERRLTMHPGILLGGTDLTGHSLADVLRPLDGLTDRMITALRHGEGRRSA